MRAIPVTRNAKAADVNGLDTLAKLATESREVIADDRDATIVKLQAQALRFQAAFDAIAQGICFFDGEERLILSNRRFAEIYRLAPEQIHPGATLREIVELRVAAGTCAAATADDYLSFCASNDAAKQRMIWTAELQDGRTVQIRRQPVSGGGWIGTHEDITELKAVRAAANERLSLQALIDRLPDNLWVKDVNSRFVIANQVTADRIGVAGPADLIGKTDFELLPKELAQKFYDDEQQNRPLRAADDQHGGIRVGREAVDIDDESAATQRAQRDLRRGRNFARHHRAKAGGRPARRAGANPRNDRDERPARRGARASRSSRGIPVQGDHRLGPAARRNGQPLRHGAAPSLPDSYAKAIDGVRIGPKAGSCGTAAYRREAVIVDDIMTDPLWEDYKDLAVELGLRSCWSTPILSHQGAVLGIFAMYAKEVREPTEAEMSLIDVATRIAGIAIERKLAEDRIHFMANHDALTGLPNRTLLNDRLSQAILHAQRYDRWVTVLFVDLDNFKFVNDSLGHNAGDELLKTIAKRMVDCVRATDTVVRLGGDEFVVVLSDQPKNADTISEIVRKIQSAIAEPVRLEGHDLRVTSSVGIANYPDDGIGVDTLLANADAAMYRAKEVGRDNIQFYTPEMNTKVHGKFLLQEDLRNALARSEFVLHYQPQVDLRTGRMFAVEALVRWNHPKLGLISPIKFVPLAEETGLIVPIGDWVLREACRQNKAWQNAGLPSVVVSVNVSARQFRERDLANRVVRALKDSGLEAEYLELELTESLIMQDIELAVATMKDLQGLGVQLSIDDFGTGYSSLSALKTFPVARLKIDKSFVDGILADENDMAVASAVISLGQKLNLRVIAEGVETEAQAAFLRNINCDEMQGYLFSKPLPAQEIEELLKAKSG